MKNPLVKKTLGRYQQHRGPIIKRCFRFLFFLHKPRTVAEIADELGVTLGAAYTYVRVVKELDIPLRERPRVVLGTGLDPKEYWVDYQRMIIFDAQKLILKMGET